jgi:hypothetical protein
MSDLLGILARKQTGRNPPEAVIRPMLARAFSTARTQVAPSLFANNLGAAVWMCPLHTDITGRLARTGGGLQAVPWLLSQAAKFAGWGSASAASRDRLHRFAVAEGSRSSDMIGLACHTSPKYPAQEG